MPSLKDVKAGQDLQFMLENAPTEGARKSINADTDEYPLIECIGIDGKQHVCQPHKDFAECGVRIARKKLGETDYKRFGCYDCTY